MDPELQTQHKSLTLQSFSTNRVPYNFRRYDNLGSILPIATSVDISKGKSFDIGRYQPVKHPNSGDHRNRRNEMCFYDQQKFSCGDFKWGHFRQHCNREYRTGETCGSKLVMSTLQIKGNCRHCDKFETKKRRRAQELDRINRWKRDGGRFTASIERSEEIVQQLECEMRELMNQRQMRLQSTR